MAQPLYLLFFLREDPLEKWDVIVSATWLKASDFDSYKIVATKFQEILSGPELTEIARVVIINSSDPVVTFLQKTTIVKNGNYEELPGNCSLR